ncbi:hypothetical protein [Flavisolibacter tropicus]|uniref:Uncharacterized protein n=1 Tax=Flavisolibacter tropicus TaxID=1492898 RepID=A0A172TSC8_9BACT|nr:hypothetical protein [Flavisolibacter tropicus]ANE49940.1 hypothetical protein SY85_04945 [Flavisolibacter tropicus]
MLLGFEHYYHFYLLIVEYSMKSLIYKAVFILLLANSCISFSQLSVWKEQNKPRVRLNKILVVSIVHDSLFEVRKNIEDCFVKTLSNHGHHSVSALETFGYKGLANMELEQTYVVLCNQGIDAVLTIALLDDNKDYKHPSNYSDKFTSSYYYKRILNYRASQVDIEGSAQNKEEPDQVLWEATLFNLSTLSPVYWAQTKPFKVANVKSYDNYCRMILNNMFKQKILR